MTQLTTDELLREIESLRSRLAQLEAAEGQRQQRARDERVEHADQLRFQSQLLDSVQESVIATDLDGQVTYWGRGAQQLYGYTADEVLGKSITFIVEPEEEQIERERMEQVFADGSWKGEYQQRRKDGSPFWASTVISLVTGEDGKPAGFIGIDVDITERKRAEEEVSQLTLAIENAMQGISRLDRQGRFVMVKPQYAGMLGYQPAELIGQSWAITVPEEDHPTAIEACEAMLGDGRATLECRALRKDGSVFYKQLLLVKSFGEDGEHDGHYCFMSDITARREAEDELRARDAQLAHVSRLSMMGELVAGVAHEINQPLYAIANYAAVAKRSLAEADDDQSRELKELNQKIADQAIRAGDIVRRLRAFVRKTDGDRSRSDLNELVRNAVAILAPMVRGTDATVQFELADGPATVLVETVLIEQVLVNLVRNALEAVADGKRRVIMIRTSLGGDKVGVSVEDTGTGIAEGTAGKLFEAFFTTKASGLGMGLAISRTIVEAHDGRIWAEPLDQGGLAVAFDLPRCRD